MINIDEHINKYRALLPAWYAAGNRGIPWTLRKQIYDEIHREGGLHDGTNCIPAVKRAMDKADEVHNPVDWIPLAREK